MLKHYDNGDNGEDVWSLSWYFLYNSFHAQEFWLGLVYEF